MIPLYDRNPTRNTPIVTILLIAACSIVYFFVQPHHTTVQDAEFTYAHAAIPCELTTGHAVSVTEANSNTCQTNPGPPAFPKKNVYLAILYSMFLHGSLLHLGGNMLFLWVFGNNIEDRAGKAGYLVFYLAAGLVATIAQVALDPNSTVPMIGASGAIAGVMGAYMVMWPNARVRTLIFFGLVFFVDITAKWLLGIWFIEQFFTNPGSGVAYMAHIGGFVFGAAVGLVWRTRGRARPALSPY